ncbi:hypothetical protein Lser_V15G39755 [Lactuca serriola]
MAKSSTTINNKVDLKFMNGPMDFAEMDKAYVDSESLTPYQCKLLLRHNIDVMHVEKNVLENILGTLLNIEKKTIHTDNARQDCRNKEDWIYLGDYWETDKAPKSKLLHSRKWFEKTKKKSKKVMRNVKI